MGFLFDPDSWIMRLIYRLCDLVVLNIVFLLTCLPVFTIGAASAALYGAVFPMDTEREGKLLATYFRCFRENFKQSTLVFGIFLLFGLATYYNMVHLIAPSALLGTALTGASIAVLVILLLIWIWVFPLICRFQNTTGNMLKNALLLALGNLPRTLLAGAILVFPWALLVMNFYAFIRVSFLWLALYFSAAAYYSSRILEPVLSRLGE